MSQIQHIPSHPIRLFVFRRHELDAPNWQPPPPPVTSPASAFCYQTGAKNSSGLAVNQ